MKLYIWNTGKKDTTSLIFGAIKSRVYHFNLCKKRPASIDASLLL